MGRQVDEELDDAPGLGPRGRRHGVEEIPGSAVADGNGRFSEQPEDDRVARLSLEWSDRPVEAPVRLVGGLGVGGGFGEVEEGFDVGQRRLVDVYGVDRLEVLAGEGRVGWVDDEPDAGRGERAGGDQVKRR